MDNPAGVDDIVARWRPLSDQETTNATAYLDDAWWMLTTRLPNLEADIENGVVEIANVKRVICAMVIRVLRNPDGKVQETIDDYSYRRATLIGSGVLTVTDDELADLTPGGYRRTNSVRLVAYGER